MTNDKNKQKKGKGQSMRNRLNLFAVINHTVYGEYHDILKGIENEWYKKDWLRYPPFYYGVMKRSQKKRRKEKRRRI